MSRIRSDHLMLHSAPVKASTSKGRAELKNSKFGFHPVSHVRETAQRVLTYIQQAFTDYQPHARPSGKCWGHSAWNMAIVVPQMLLK